MPALQDHPLACIFPLLHDSELTALADDIEVNGLREPIWLYEDKILDGRNRYRACVMKGIDQRIEHYIGKDPLGFVLSMNLHRRHLTESQRAMVAAEIANLHQGEQKNSKPANLPVSPVSQANSAEMLNISERSVRDAVKVKDKAEPEIVEAVKAGKLPVSTAAKAAKLPKKKQQKIAASEDPAKAAREEVKKAEAKEDPAADPLEVFVGELNRLCRLTDALKKEVEKAVNSHPLGKKFVHIESITTQLHAARSAMWQSRPTEECNCVKRDKKPHPDCRACHSTGKCPAGRVLKGVR
jgi:hypothetical protein